MPLSAAVLGLSVAPGLAGDGGGIDNTGVLLVQAVSRLAGKLLGMF